MLSVWCCQGKHIAKVTVAFVFWLWFDPQPWHMQWVVVTQVFSEFSFSPLYDHRNAPVYSEGRGSWISCNNVLFHSLLKQNRKIKFKIWTRNPSFSGFCSYLHTLLVVTKPLPWHTKVWPWHSCDIDHNWSLLAPLCAHV